MSCEFIGVETLYKLNGNANKVDVNAMRMWIGSQPHIPEISDRLIILFLHSCYYNQEATKKCIKEFYLARSRHPDLFSKRDPRTFKDDLQNFCISPLPKLTPEGYGIIFITLINTDVKYYDFNLHVKVNDMINLLWLEQMGCLEGHVVILNMKGGSLSHLFSVNLSTLKIFFQYLQEAFPFRLKGIHFCNPVTFMGAVMKCIKPFISKQLADLIHVHSGTSILNLIPAESLPDCIGGTLSTHEIHAAAIKMLLDNADYFVQDEKSYTKVTSMNH